MKRRRLIRISVLLAVLAGLAVWLEPTRVVWGWLRGEAFYQGRPTSYWAERIRPWQLDEHMRASALADCLELPQPRSRRSIGPDVQGRHRPGVSGWIEGELTPDEGPFRRWAKTWLPLPDIPWPAVLDGDPAAETVLTELLDHAEPGIADWARRGLRRIGTDEKGPRLRFRVASGPI